MKFEVCPSSPELAKFFAGKFFLPVSILEFVRTDGQGIDKFGKQSFSVRVNSQSRIKIKEPKVDYCVRENGTEEYLPYVHTGASKP